MGIYFAIAMGVVGLVFAYILSCFVGKAEPGTERMKEISAAIHQGAKAFLFAEYRVLVVFVVVLFLAIGFGLGNWVTAFCFVCGSAASVLAGYCGMNVATKANVRTARAAEQKGMVSALAIAFRGGAVMGMCVVGLGLLGCTLVYYFTGDPNVLSGFSLGASSIALFARVGGGIYTKAADVGADLVGKVESGIPEDDPRNPAVIADNVGDNVGDVAGMGADLFESYVGAIVSAVTLGIMEYQAEGAIFPLVLSAIGVLSSVIGCLFVRGDENSNPHKALKMGSYVSSILVTAATLWLSHTVFGDFKAAIAIIAGLVVGLLIPFYLSFSESSIMATIFSNLRSLHLRPLSLRETYRRAISDRTCHQHHHRHRCRHAVQRTSHSVYRSGNLCLLLCVWNLRNRSGSRWYAFHHRNHRCCGCLRTDR